MKALNQMAKRLRLATYLVATLAGASGVAQGQAALQWLQNPELYENARNVEIDLTHLLCDETTGDPGRDEVIVRGAWVRHKDDQELSSASLALPRPEQVTLFGPQGLYTATSYGHYGSINDNDFVFKSDKPVFHGLLLDGEVITATLVFWEKDLGTDSEEAADNLRDSMISTIVNGVTSGGYSVQDFFDLAWNFVLAIYGANDKLGAFTVEVRNEGGVIKKTLETDRGKEYFWNGEVVQPPPLSLLGKVIYHQTATAYTWDPSRIQELLSEGYEVVFTSLITYQVILVRDIKYKAISSSGEQVRVVMRTNGRYQASVEVRAAGVPQTWTKESTTSAF